MDLMIANKGKCYGTVQYSTVQYSTVQYSTVQYSTVQYSRLSVFGRVEPTLLYDRKQRPKMEMERIVDYIINER
jgi:hypothetical protein